MKEYKNNYPSIFVHGFIGWGDQDDLMKVANYWGILPTRRLPKHLREEGYEAYYPSLGPFCSAWDRACELYAYIFGGTVDYGKVHSEKYNHKRYGRTYEGVLKDLGKTKEHKKVNVYGHSFGGPTVKAFVELMNNGSAEEREGTPAEDLSDFFKGGHAHLIHTANTLSGVNNGTILDQAFNDKTMHMAERVVLTATSKLGHTRYNRIYDFGQQQFGLGLYPEETQNGGVHQQSKAEFEEGVRKYASSKLDRSNWEMDIIWSKWMNDHQGVAPTIYYFAERTCSSHIGKDGFAHPNDRNPITAITGYYIGRKQPERETGYEYGPEWYLNDGYVPIIGQSAPLNQPSIEAGPATEFKPGIWYNMPVGNGDHMVWNGMGPNKWEFFRRYDEMLERARLLPDGEDVI